MGPEAPDRITWELVRNAESHPTWTSEFVSSVTAPPVVCVDTQE